jgi:hypothetical protein
MTLDWFAEAEKVADELAFLLTALATLGAGLGRSAAKRVRDAKLTIFGRSEWLGKRLDRTILGSRGSLGGGHVADRQCWVARLRCLASRSDDYRGRRIL